jgi:hypothetical protein
VCCCVLTYSPPGAWSMAVRAATKILSGSNVSLAGKTDHQECHACSWLQPLQIYLVSTVSVLSWVCKIKSRWLQDQPHMRLIWALYETEGPAKVPQFWSKRTIPAWSRWNSGAGWCHDTVFAERLWYLLRGRCCPQQQPSERNSVGTVHVFRSHSLWIETALRFGGARDTKAMVTVEVSMLR